MNWFYIEQGKQAGPVDDARLEQLEAERKIQDETLVWHEGMANWQPYRDVRVSTPPVLAAPAPPFVAPAPSAPAIGLNEAVCAECRNVFPAENMIRYGNAWVCANCKPVFMQKIAEGVATTGGGHRGMATQADLLARDYDVDIGDSISKGWATFKANAGILIGASVLIYVAVAGSSFALTMLRIMYLPLVVNFLLAPPLRAGLWLVYVKAIRGGQGSLNDAFSGFSSRYWQTVLVAAIPAVLALGVTFIWTLFLIMTMPGHIAPRSSPLPYPASVPESAMFPLSILLIIGGVALCFISTCWLFALPLVIDKGLQFWSALELSRRVVMKHWWGTFGLVLLAGIIGISGIFALCVGVLVTGPLAFAMLATHYEKVFGDLVPEAA